MTEASLLAEARLAAPRPRPIGVERPRVMQALDSGTALTLVAAPPGSGKTTAVRTWTA
jgi:ATP/maltotriose-dependent transcriptional regulator MalT